MKEMITKQFEGKDIRTNVDENGDIWFVAKDVMEVLGIKSQRHALRKLENDDKTEFQIPSPSGHQTYSFVSESGIYELIMQSRKAEAKSFKRWVTKDVLPSIRKTGSYSFIQKTPAEQLLAQAQFMVEVERQAKLALQAVSEVKQDQLILGDRVGNVETTVKQIARHNTGSEKLPDGLISIQNLTRKYFNGVSEAVVNEWLKSTGHPSQPLTYVIGNSYHVKDIFVEEGLGKSFDTLVRSSEFIKQTDKNIQCRNDLIVEDFRFKKEFAQYWAQEYLTR